jgi:hypothetical protein
MVNPDPNPRRPDPAINRALGLPPLLTGEYDEDPEPPMGQGNAALLIAVYVLVFGFGIVCVAATHDHLGTLHLGHTQNFLALYPLTPAS